MARTIWNGNISALGFVIPVIGESVVSESKTELHFFSPWGNRVKQVYVDAVSGLRVDWPQLRKGYTSPNGDLVIVTQDDLEQVHGETERNAQITKFVPADQVPNEARRRPVRLQPARKEGPKKQKKDDPAAILAYALLAESMREERLVGIIEFGIRQTKRTAVLEQIDGRLYITPLEFAEDMPEAGTATPAAEFTTKERKMGRELVRAMKGEFSHANVKDTSREELRKVITRRIEAGETETPQDAPVQAAEPAVTTEAPRDLTEVLGGVLAQLAQDRDEARGLKVAA